MLIRFVSFSVILYTQLLVQGHILPLKKIQNNINVWWKKNALSSQYKYMMLCGIEMSWGSKNGLDEDFEDPNTQKYMCISWHNWVLA